MILEENKAKKSILSILTTIGMNANTHYFIQIPLANNFGKMAESTYHCVFPLPPVKILITSTGAAKPNMELDSCEEGLGPR